MSVLDLYPLCEAALAQPAADPRFAERFELYACGVELANAFGELTNPVEQRARFVQEMAERERIYGESYPLTRIFSMRWRKCRLPVALRWGPNVSLCWHLARQISST